MTTTTQDNCKIEQSKKKSQSLITNWIILKTEHKQRNNSFADGNFQAHTFFYIQLN